MLACVRSIHLHVAKLLAILSATQSLNHTLRLLILGALPRDKLAETTVSDLFRVIIDRVNVVIVASSFLYINSGGKLLFHKNKQGEHYQEIDY